MTLLQVTIQEVEGGHKLVSAFVRRNPLLGAAAHFDLTTEEGIRGACELIQKQASKHRAKFVSINQYGAGVTAVATNMSNYTNFRAKEHFSLLDRLTLPPEHMHFEKKGMTERQ
jgi:hypothetical protein